MIERTDHPEYIYLHSDLVITNYNPDTDDISSYSGDKNVYLPLDADISKYHEISEKLHFEYESQKRKKQSPDISEVIIENPSSDSHKLND